MRSTGSWSQKRTTTKWKMHMPNEERDLRALELVTRRMSPIPTSYDGEKRTMQATIATENPVDVWDWERGAHKEILLADGMKMEGNQIPLLDSHLRYSIDSMLGSIRSIKAENGSITGTLHFDSTDDGKKAEIKAREGHLTDISAGYQRLKSTWIPEKQSTVIAGRTFEGPLRVTPEWKLKEGSLRPIGADGNSKTRSAMDPNIKQLLIQRGLSADATDEEAQRLLERELRDNPNIKIIERRQPMPETPVLTEKEIRSQVQTQERERISHINAVAARHLQGFKPDDQYRDMEIMRSTAVEKGWTKDEFNDEILKRLSGVVPATPANADESVSSNLGMSIKDVKSYSIVRAMQSLIHKEKLDGLEKEVNDALEKTCKRGAMSGLSFRIPNDVVVHKRALGTATGSAGGFTVDTEVLGTSLIELLRNQTLVAELGARQLSGLTGNIA